MWSITGRLLETLQACLLDLPDLITTSRRRSMSRRSSAIVLGGIGSPSGVRKSSRRSAAFFSLGLKPRMPSRINVAFIRLTIRLCSPTRLSRSRLGRLASSS